VAARNHNREYEVDLVLEFEMRRPQLWRDDGDTPAHSHDAGTRLVG
jgi:hypothetical protein